MKATADMTDDVECRAPVVSCALVFVMALYFIGACALLVLIGRAL